MTRTNRYESTCADCGQQVPAGEGRLSGKPGAWKVTHLPECPVGAAAPVAGVDFTPTAEQEACLALFTAGKSFAIEAGAGCLAADTVVHLNRGGKGYRSTIEAVAAQVAGQPMVTRTLYGKTITQRTHPWDLTIPTRIARSEGDVIRLGPFGTAWHSGVKETLRLITDSGRQIRATAIHPFLTAEGEWAQMGDLRAGDSVQVNTGRSVRGRAPKLQYRIRQTRHHPHQVRRSTDPDRWGVPEHRLAVEADMNGLSLESLLALLNEDPASATALTYLSPGVHVHHEDHNTKNNSLSNLVVMTTQEHARHHAALGARENVLWQTGTERIQFVTAWGEEPTFDIEVADDPHNFLANGFVVHNTGKTATLKLLAVNTAAKGAYMAFNKGIVDDSAKKMPRNVEARTIHGWSFHHGGGKAFKHRMDGPRQRSEDTARFLGIGPFFCTYGDGAGAERKVLQPGHLAGVVLKAVRRFAQSADTEPGTQHFAYVDGIDKPTVDGKRTYANNAELRRTLLPALKKAWADQTDPAGQTRYEQDSHVKMWELAGAEMDKAFIVVDECFPAGTLVDTRLGPVPIEKIAESPDEPWEVLSTVDGGKTLVWSHVTTAYRTPRKGPLVSVTHEGGVLRCTVNHPVWIQNEGWVPAGLVRPGSFVRLVSPSAGEGERGVDVLPIVRTEAERCPTRPGDREAAAREDRHPDATSAPGNPQPDEQPGNTGQGLGDTPGEGTSAVDQGRQRERTDAPRGDAFRSVDGDLARWAMEPRACRAEWTRLPEARTATALQDRRGIDATALSDRGGRVFTCGHGASGAGSAEGFGTSWARVDRVEIHQQRSDGGSGIRSGADPDSVYTLSVADTACYYAEGVLVRNCQDLSAVMASILRKNRARGVQVVAVGDPAQCQPTGTEVTLSRTVQDGQRRSTEFYEKAIEEVQPGDQVVSYDQTKSYLRRQGSRVARVAARPYDGALVTVQGEDGRESSYTPEHQCVARIGEALRGKWVVYMMRRGESYRVGVTAGMYASQRDSLALVLRAKAEDADAAWVLATHDSEYEARVDEAVTAYRFGVPMLRFQQGASRGMTQGEIDLFWTKMGNLSEQAGACLKAHGRDQRYPLFTKGQWLLRRRSAVFAACNLIDGMEVLPLSGALDANHKRVSRQRWEPIAVGRTYYSGLVHSLEVEGDHTYVADGIVTHNCIYEWRGSVSVFEPEYADLFDGHATLTQSFRFGSEIAHVANLLLDKAAASLRISGNPDLDSTTGIGTAHNALLTRTNAGAVSAMFEAVAKGLKVHLVGGGKEVARFAAAAEELQMTGSTNHPELACFTSWAEVQSYVELDPQGEELRLLVKLIDEFGAAEVRDLLGNQPEPAKADLVISTAHKAKGLEWDRVRIHTDFADPDARDDGRSEWRLLYVAATRAKLHLDHHGCAPVWNLTNPAADDLGPAVVIFPAQPDRRHEPVPERIWATPAPEATATPQTPQEAPKPKPVPSHSHAAPQAPRRPQSPPTYDVAERGEPKMWIGRCSTGCKHAFKTWGHLVIENHRLIGLYDPEGNRVELPPCPEHHRRPYMKELVVGPSDGTRCNASCWNALSAECACPCRGRFHGQGHAPTEVQLATRPEFEALLEEQRNSR